MNIRRYHIGLFETVKLECVEDGKYYYYFKIQNEVFMLVCDIHERSMKRMKRQDGRNFAVLDVENEIERNVKHSLSDDGSRWEGDWYNGKPFGFGELYDGDGNKMYSGFMFDGKKIGFGEEYFADICKVDYCGNFMDDLRHGWGCSYDRNGEKLYEGDWRCGKNDFEDERIVIEDNCEKDCLRIHDLIKELEIGENCLNEWEDDLVIQNYPNLQSIVVKKNSLKNLKSLKICNCEKLKTIEIEDGDKWQENGAFSNVKNVIIESI